jgi:hypothetical protein
MDLIIRNIIETNGSWSHVVVSREVFMAVMGKEPKMEFTSVRNALGQKMRAFQFNGGHILYSRLDYNTMKNVFVTSAETAKMCLRNTENGGVDNLPVTDISF